MKKLVLFGDSLFARIGKELINKLENKLPGYDIYNCAAGGWNTDDAVKKSPFIASLKADIVVISLGLNDAAPWKQVPLPNFEKNMNKILHNFKNSRIIFFLPPPVNVSKELGDTKRLNEIGVDYYEIAKKICSKNKVEIIDSWKLFTRLLEKGKDYHIEDGVHINDFGYDIFIDQLAKTVLKSSDFFVKA